MKLIKELWQYREMIFNLVKRELRSRYKGSVLGFFWMLLNPLLQMCVYMIAFSVIIKMDIDKFYLFLFVALVPWMFFSTCLSSGTTVIIREKDLVKKIYFPREVLPVAFTLSQFINMLLSFIVIFLAVIFSRVRVPLSALLFLPVVMMIEFLLALGIVLICSSLTVYLRDLEHILLIISMVWMYMTPVIYPVEYIPDNLRRLFYMNPMTSIIVAYRDILYYGHAPEGKLLLNAFTLCLVVLLIGEIAFMCLKRGFGKEL